MTVGYGNDVLAASHTVDGHIIWTPDVTWELTGSGDSNYAYFPDTYDSLLMIKQLLAGRTITVKVTVKTINATLTYSKSLGLWNRVPEVGDFAWTDGTFDREDDQSKLLAGVVVMREPLVTDQEGDITKARLWVLGTENISVPASTDGSSADIPASGDQSMSSSWGMYPDANNVTGFLNTKGNDNVYTDDLMAMIQAYLVDVAQTHSLSNDIFDTKLPNLSTSFTISPSTYQDDANEQPVSGSVDNAEGTARLTNSAAGDGTGYLQRTSSEGAMDFATIYNNKTLMEFADNVLRALIDGLGISTEELPAGVDRQTYRPTTLQGYADLTLLIQRYIAAMLQSTEANPVTPATADLTWTDGNGRSLAVFRELMFPAFRLCSIWSPSYTSNTGITEDKLHDAYKRGKWMLPSNGLLARIFNFLWNSSCTTDPTTGVKSRTDGAAVTRDNESDTSGVSLQEAQLPLFSNVLERSDGRRIINLSTGRHHWSSTEYYRYSGRYVGFSTGHTSNTSKYYSYVARAVAAFTFEA